MIRFSINNKEYSLKDSIYDVTIKDGIDIVKIDVISESKLKSFLDSDDIIEDADIINYSIEVLSILSNVSKDILKTLDAEYIHFLIMYVKTILLFLYRYNFEKHESLGMTDLVFKGVKYYIPPSLKINDDHILFFKEASKNVLEVSNLMRIMEDMEDKGIELMPYIAAIYLREDVAGINDEEVIKKRADIFIDLPLYIAYDLFFYTYYYICSSVIASRIFLERKDRKKMCFLKRLKSLIIGSIS